ncbi:MAG: putative toxin-antitoxin system toxin component, PIN family [Nitrospirae bacterium]|nr:putative toxin-antitoxin system toxin component, PIN family [Nitrospirota bacterium]
MIKVVYDTNIFISGLLWKGLPYKCLLLAKAKAVELFLCEKIIFELSSKLKNRFDFTDIEVEKTIKEIKSFSKNIKIEGNLRVVKEDSDDDKFIECACNANADCIVSGDRHLLNLKSYNGIEILNARDFLIKIRGT